MMKMWNRILPDAELATSGVHKKLDCTGDNLQLCVVADLDSQAPGVVTRTGWLLSDNLNLLIAVAGLFAMLAYYIPT